MAKDSQPRKRKLQTDKMKEGDSVKEITFSLVFDCLSQFTAQNNFLGFTLNSEYVAVHKSKSNELSQLQNYFSDDILKAILVYRIDDQIEPVIKWTNREAMERYLRSKSKVE